MKGIVIIAAILSLPACKSFEIGVNNIPGAYNKYQGKRFTEVIVKPDSTFTFKVIEETIIKSCYGRWKVIEKNRVELQCLTDTTLGNIITLGFIGRYRQELQFKGNDKIKLRNEILKREEEK